MQILAATNRRRSTTDAGEMFSGERAEETSYASVTVAIPPDSARRDGQVQWPASLTGNTPARFRHRRADHLDKRAFSAAMSSAAKQGGRSKVLIFVHGFNNRFDDAVYRFAQIVHDCEGRRHSGVVHLAVARRIAFERLCLRQGERELFARCAGAAPGYAGGQSPRERGQYPGAFDGELGHARGAAGQGHWRRQDWTARSRMSFWWRPTWTSTCFARRFEEWASAETAFCIVRFAG